MTYTRDEIMAMSAEELRVAIAKKLGWTFSKTAGGNVWGYFRGSIGSLGYSEIEALTVESEKLNINTDYPHDIAAAYELVEEIRRGGDEITLNSDRRGNGSAIYSVVVLRLRNDNTGTGWTQIVNSEADTAPLAISRAWLIWSEESGK